MLTVYLLRHGQTAWNADNNRYCGRTDIELTSTGIAQARRVREQVNGLHFDGVFSSPLQRALQTATIIVTPMQPTVDERLIEVDFGKWEGKCRDQFVADDPESWEQWKDDPGSTPAGRTGETAMEVINRVDGFFNNLVRTHASGTVLVVAHNTVNRLYLSYKLGMPLKHYRRISIDNSSISEFSLDHLGEITLKQLNNGQKLQRG